jgi:hypothetical protein
MMGFENPGDQKIPVTFRDWGDEAAPQEQDGAGAAALRRRS